MKVNKYCPCPICKVNLNKKGVHKHLENVHGLKSVHHRIAIIKSTENLENKNKNKDSDSKYNSLTVANSKLYINLTTIKYLQLDKEIKNIKNYEYYEQVKDLIFSIQKRLDYFSENIEYGNCEKKKLAVVKKEFEDQKLNLPKEEEFIQSYCEKIYITWDNIRFGHKEIRIFHKNKVLESIELKGSLEILNQIKVEYFQRLHHSSVYKLIIKDGKIRKEFSPDLKKIKGLIYDEYDKIKIQTIAIKTSTEKVSILKETMTKSEILVALDTHFTKNKFLKIAAKYLEEKDKVRAYNERNNGNLEEALLFIFQRGNFYYYLWENINIARAAYLFKIHSNNHSDSFVKIVNLIKSDVKNKREMLFGSADIEKLFKIKCIDYRRINHDNIARYKYQLQNLIY